MEIGWPDVPVCLRLYEVGERSPTGQVTPYAIKNSPEDFRGVCMGGSSVRAIARQGTR